MQNLYFFERELIQFSKSVAFNNKFVKIISFWLVPHFPMSKPRTRRIQLDKACLLKNVPFWVLFKRQDTQHNDTQHNDTQHNDTEHDDTQHNDTQHKIKNAFNIWHST
jgi:hypothetical protein